MKRAGIRCTIDKRYEKIGFKIREAQLDKIPYMAVIGGKEAEAGQIAVRSRSDGDQGVMAQEDFINRIILEDKNKVK